MTDEGTCGRCGTRLGSARFCPICGQAVGGMTQPAFVGARQDSGAGAAQQPTAGAWPPGGAPQQPADGAWQAPPAAQTAAPSWTQPAAGFSQPAQQPAQQTPSQFRPGPVSPQAMPPRPAPQLWFSGSGPYGAAALAPVAPVASIRPVVVSALAIVMIGSGVVNLWVAWLYYNWAGFMSHYDGLSVLIDAAMAIAYIVAAGAAFTIATGMWSLKRSAWPGAVVLLSVLIGLIAFSIWRTKIGPLDVVGLVVYVPTLACFFLTQVRVTFGRDPLPLGAPRQR